MKIRLFSKRVKKVKGPEPCPKCALLETCTACGVTFKPPYQGPHFAIWCNPEQWETRDLVKEFCSRCVPAALDKQRAVQWTENNVDKVKKLMEKK